MRGKRVKRAVLERRKRIHHGFDSFFFPQQYLRSGGTPTPPPAAVEKDIFKVKNLQDEVHLTKESKL